MLRIPFELENLSDGPITEVDTICCQVNLSKRKFQDTKVLEEHEDFKE